MLPAIIFLPTRRECDQAALKFRGIPWKDKNSRFEIFAEVAEGNPYLWRNPLITSLIDSGVASHHAGHLTGWKVAVERMLARGKLRAVFATTTLAAGLDVPARTVVLPTLLVRDEFGIRFLNATEFHQMTGRAGRRGKDKVGFVILLGRDKDLLLALNLQHAEPEPIRSAFKLNYYQILNLLFRFTLDKTKDILEKSLLLFQQGSRKDFKRVKTRLWEELEKRMEILRGFGYLDDSGIPTELGKWALLIRHEHFLVLAEVIRRKLYPLSPAELAGWAGALTSGHSPRRIVSSLELCPLLNLAAELEKLEKRKGIFTAQFSPTEAWGKGAAVKLWAEGEEWEKIVAEAEIEEGDFQWLVLQAAELLHQLEELPLPIATPASKARNLLLRAPAL